MFYDLSLRIVGLVMGLLLILGHLPVFLQEKTVRSFLATFARSKPLGIVLLTVGMVWTWSLVATMDLGEFSKMRTVMLIVIPVLYGLTLVFADDFLAVRGLGIVVLLAAEVLLSAAFLEPQRTRLLLVVLAYVWIFLGLFWVGIPYTLRDQIDWLLKTASRLKLAALGGLVYGAVILICALLFY